MKCPICKYDLRGITGSNCPECGAGLSIVTTDREDPKGKLLKYLNLALSGIAAVISYFIIERYSTSLIVANHFGNFLSEIKFPVILGLFVAVLILFTGHPIWLPLAILILKFVVFV